ncbi:MAG: AAA family ATPase [Phascolarctobacterium sp.]|nr:AAA family ATPase [Phascolarctobacterium sp.]
MIAFDMRVKTYQNLNTTENSSAAVKTLQNIVKRLADELGIPILGVYYEDELPGVGQFSEELDEKLNYEAHICACFEWGNVCLNTLRERIKEEVNKKFNNTVTHVDFCEISPQFILEAIRDDHASYRKELFKKLKTLLETDKYALVQKVVPEEELNLVKALARARSFHADKSYTDEIRRIFSKDNEKRYAGHPVHYRLLATTTDMACRMAELLVQCLNSNNRLLSNRVDIVYNLNPMAAKGQDLEFAARRAIGSTLVLDTSYGFDAKKYEKEAASIIDTISDVMKRVGEHTLGVFVEISGRDNFCDTLTQKLADDLNIITLKEGKMNAVKASKEVAEIIKQSELSTYYNPKNFSVPEREEGYTSEEVLSLYRKWRISTLKNVVYKSYKEVNESIPTVTSSDDAYSELMNMVGLTDVKLLVKQLLATHKINQQRQKEGLKNAKQVLHMLFSGNAGSAKTTVARLLAKILATSGITKSDKLVECSRADIVGKYVGWTANLVQEKFEAAKGGVLFIDEAYSLVGSGNDFGQEAITSLVQLMENHRDDVVVIFAGYPDKMQEFLNQNEGLKSRIAFHLNFPDYDAREMISILELMVDKQDYELSNDARFKCEEIFANALKEDNFGNGRFVRNLLEQAIMQHALRLSEQPGEEYDKKSLKTLSSEDFIDKTHRLKTVTRRIGLEF